MTETMAAMGILAGLAVLAAPSVERLASTYRVRETAYEISSAVTLARSEAIKRGRDVMVVSASGGWSNGWSILPVSTPESVIRVRDPLQKVGLTSTLSAFRFNKEGRVVDSQGVPVTVKLTVNPYRVDDGVKARCLILAPSGVPSSREGPCA